MSIRQLTHRVKSEVKCYGLWRKTSTAKTKETVSTYIMSYLDETSKAEALEESRKVGYAAVQHGVAAPQQLGIDYLSKEEKGRIPCASRLSDQNPLISNWMRVSISEGVVLSFINSSGRGTFSSAEIDTICST